MNGRPIATALAPLGILVLAVALSVALHLCAGCAIFQNEDARTAAEIGCVERYKTRDQIEACREIVQGITSRYARDAGDEQ